MNVRAVLEKRRRYLQLLLSKPGVEEATRKLWESQVVGLDEYLGSIKSWAFAERSEIAIQNEMLTAYKSWRAGSSAEAELERFRALSARLELP